MITLLTRTRSAPLTADDVETWARLHLRNDAMWYWLRRHSLPLDQRDAEKMFAETDAADEPDDV